MALHAGLSALPTPLRSWCIDEARRRKASGHGGISFDALVYAVSQTDTALDELESMSNREIWELNPACRRSYEAPPRTQAPMPVAPRDDARFFDEARPRARAGEKTVARPVSYESAFAAATKPKDEG
jgi:hypothetical protein